MSKTSSFLRNAFLVVAGVSIGGAAASTYAWRDDIFNAVAGTDLGGVQALILQAMDKTIVSPNEENSYSLSAAAAIGYIPSAVFLAERGYGDMQRALYAAANAGKKDTAIYALDHGASLKQGNYYAVSGAASSGNIDLIKTFMARDEGVASNMGIALSSAIPSHQQAMIDFILGTGAVDLQKECGQILIDSIAYGPKETVTKFLGVCPDLVSATGMSPDWLVNYAKSFEQDDEDKSNTGITQLIQDVLAKRDTALTIPAPL